MIGTSLPTHWQFDLRPMVGKMVADHPDIPNEIAAGNFAPVLAWMRENVHRYASRYDPQDLVQKITGSRINPEPYMRYLEQKYSQIYQL